VKKLLLELPVPRGGKEARRQLTKTKIDIKINSVVIPNVVMLMICRVRRFLCDVLKLFPGFWMEKVSSGSFAACVRCVI
jgi:hypothetical protein